ncbi:MAG: glycerol kinase GlpK [Pirellulaceae bacterium]|jgi:glycerol kinase|nr:glycerol kinase GlpK [Pirellulaceae bacterium]
MHQYILALDQGTTSSRAIVFDHQGRVVAAAQQELPQILPRPGEVEHDPEAIWDSQLSVARAALARGQIAPQQIAALGVTNQRETTILWDRQSGRPVHPAIVWQSRVSAGICEQLRAAGCEQVIRDKTGLWLDPYFSGTKIRYLLAQDPSLRARAERGDVLFGTVDSFLIWRLTGGRCHVTDVSNASRTMLFNLDTLAWDDELLAILEVPRAMLPEVRPSSQVYGYCDAACLGHAVAIAGDAGDQQAATFGQACFERGTAKNTYGTGCFLLLNVGDQPLRSAHRLLTTVGWQVGAQVTYCLEGSVFVAGAVVQWLRDGLGLIAQSQDVEALAATVPDSGGVVFVPAFVGLGAPYWDPYACGAVFGITRGTTAGHLARAAIESMALQTCDLLDAMRRDAQAPLTILNVDGGASVNNALMQFQADMLQLTVQRPVVRETTALGAAYLAGLAVGYWESLADVARNWALDRSFAPAADPGCRESILRRWRRAVERVRHWDTPSP